MSADFLEHLSALAAPIFTAPPGTDREFARPTGWHRLAADGNAARIAAWQPGHALMAVMGGNVAVLDVDTKNGADPERIIATLKGIGCRVYAHVFTPSGGRHLYVPGHPDLPTVPARKDRDGIKGHPGVEVISYGANVFLPGTARAKYPGAHYVVLTDDLEALADGGDPDSADALAAWVAEHRAHAAPTWTKAPAWDGTAPDRRQAAYLATVLDSQCRDLAAMPPDSGRNGALYLAAMKCGSYVAGAGLDEAHVVARLTDAAAACGLTREDGEHSVRASIRSGLTNGRANPKAVPPASDQLLGIVAPTGDDRAQVAPADDTSNADTDEDSRRARRLQLTTAATIRPRRVRWLWTDRLALGTLALLAGPEGLGKSTLGYWLAARITRGELPGENHGTPRSVLVCASEDSWEHTIVPRLMAAGADLTRVYRVEVVTADEIHVGLSLPRDLAAVAEAATTTDAALLLLDPLMSRLSESLDTHRDGDVRRALEPLVAIADRTGMAVLALIHHNKSGSSDPLQLVMASKAFTAVARSVHSVIRDPDDESEARRLFGTPKNNLGRTDLPTLTFTIVGHPIDTDDGTAWTGRLEWGEDVAGSIADAMRRSADDHQTRSATSEAADWLADYLAINGSTSSATVKRDATKAGHGSDALRRARERIKAVVEHVGFPRITYWGPPVMAAVGAQLGQVPRGERLTATTAITGGPVAQSWQSWQSGGAPETPATTDALTGIDPQCSTCERPLYSRESRERRMCAHCADAAATTTKRAAS